MSQEASVQQVMQSLRIELNIITDRVAAAVALNARDLDILDVVVHDGPLSPSRLSGRTGVHAATLTGAIARLERDGWVTRTRAPVDGRSTVIAAVPERVVEIERLYAPVNRRLGTVLKRLTPAQAKTMTTFVTEVAGIVRQASDELGPGPHQVTRTATEVPR